MITEEKIKKVIKEPNRKEIILEFLKEDSKETYAYNEIKKFLLKRNMSPRADHHLKKLVEEGLLEKAKRGIYKLNEIAIQPLRIHYDIVVPICLIGGLGIPTLFTDILKALEEISILPKKYILITSPDYHEEFQKLDKGKFSEIETVIHEYDYQSVLRENYNKIYKELEKNIKKALHKYEVICEITGGTKPVSVALLNLSTEYKLRRCYFSGRKIIWI